MRRHDAGSWLLPGTSALLLLVLCTWMPGPVTVTWDEPTWLARSDHFRDALSDGDLASANAAEGSDLDRATSPGVTTMWAGTAGHVSVRGLQRLGLLERRPPGPRTGQQMLRAGRVFVSLLCAAALALLIWFLTRLVGRRAAFAAGLLLAIEPFLVGHAGLLHTDALVTLWGATSVAALAAGLAGRAARTPSVLVSAAAAAIAAATKVTAVPLVVGGVGLVAIAAIISGDRASPMAERLRHLAGALGAWATTATATFVLLWPAMWVAPMQSVRQMVDAVGQSDGYDVTFFRGELRADPGVGYYPVGLLVRLSPWIVVAALVGLVLGVLALRARALATDPVRPFVAAVILAPVPYLIIVTIASQKYDRYALPVLPGLAVAAGLAVVAMTSRITNEHRRVQVERAGLVVVLLLAVSTLVQAPYAIAYVDPLVGQERAERLVLLGWGEGIEQLGAEVQRREGGNCDRIDILMFNPERGIALPCGRLDRPDANGYEYAVRYITQRQRSPKFYATVGRLGSRVKSVRIGGAVYAELWTVDGHRPR